VPETSPFIAFKNFYIVGLVGALFERSEFAQTRKTATFGRLERYWGVFFFGSFLLDKQKKKAV